MILRLIGWQGVAGIIVAAALALLLLVQKGETRHWRKQSGHYEQLHRVGEAALAGTVANYRAAADRARAADRAASARVAAEQSTINQRTAYDYQARLAAARARADQLRRNPATAAADPGARRAAPMPGLAAPPAKPAQAASQTGLPPEDALTATEQAIQLDELIKWLKGQHAVDANAPHP